MPLRNIFPEPNGSGARLRCELSRTVHFKKNVLDKVRGKDKAWVKGRLDDIFLAPDKETGFVRLQQLVANLADSYPGVANILEVEGEDVLTCHNFPLSIVGVYGQPMAFSVSSRRSNDEPGS